MSMGRAVYKPCAGVSGVVWLTRHHAFETRNEETSKASPKIVRVHCVAVGEVAVFSDPMLEY